MQVFWPRNLYQRALESEHLSTDRPGHGRGARFLPQSGQMPRTPLPDRPFTAAQAAAAGIGRGTLSGHRVRRLFDGVYVRVGIELSHVTWVSAARLILPPDTVASGSTALRLHGVEVGPEFPLRFCTTHRRQVRQPRLLVVRTTRLPANDGRAVSPDDAFLTAAAYLNLLDLVIAGDWLVRLKLTTPERLRARAAGHHGRGVPLARRAAGLVRARVDSPRETKLRLCLVLAGLPEPETNILLGNDDGPIGSPDLVLRALKVLLEYEGDHHRLDKDQWNTDIFRAEEFQAEGYALVRVTALHLRHPRQLARRVYRVLVERGYDGPEPRFDREWVELF